MLTVIPLGSMLSARHLHRFVSVVSLALGTLLALPSHAAQSVYAATNTPAAIPDNSSLELEFPPFHGRLSAEEFSAGMVAVATGGCSDFA